MNADNPLTIPSSPSEPTSSERKISSGSHWLAWMLDDLIVIPGINLGVGLDGVLGLIPGIGDAATTATSGILFIEAIRNRVPLSVISRMALNIVIDAIVGLIPAIGDIADFAHRANRKNLRLINQAIENREQAAKQSSLYLAAALAIAIATIGLLLVGFAFVIWAMLNIKIG